MILDPDYARVFTQARIIAWQYGYACCMHGSYTRDLDLLLTPWEDRATANHEQLLKLIAQACGLRFRDGQEDILKSKADFTDKPHGRKSCSLFFPEPADRRWVDISFTPCERRGSAAGNAEYDSWRIEPAYLSPDWIAAEDAIGGVLAAGALGVKTCDGGRTE